MSTNKETYILRRIYTIARSLGFLVYRLDGSLVNGQPDLLLIGRNGGVLFIEVKTPTGRLSNSQIHEHNRLTSYGMDVRVMRSAKEAKECLTEVSRAWKVD